MRLTRLRVCNFRNLESIDVPLSGGAVVVGENRAGKSNLLHALRLVLDPALSSAQRTLSPDDFSESIGQDPMGDGAVIEVAIEVEDFGNDAGLVSTLHPALISGDPMRARLTYRFGPREDKPDAYAWTIYGGDDRTRRIGSELRTFLHHVPYARPARRRGRHRIVAPVAATPVARRAFAQLGSRRTHERRRGT
jgi:putative ATP-dependent endonuclease of OLD family